MMKKSALIVFLIVGLVVISAAYVMNKDSVSRTYQNTKFGYQITLPDGWYVLHEESDKDNVIISNNPTPDKSNDKPFGTDRIAIGLTPNDESAFQEVSTAEKTLKAITTKNGFTGFIRLDNSQTSKGTVVSLQFSSENTLTTNGLGQKPKTVVFLWSGIINEDAMMEIINTFKKI